MNEQVVSIILAGGKGTRIQHLLPNIPKPMYSVAGKPFIEWVCRFLKKQSVEQICISTGYLDFVIKEHFDINTIEGLHIHCYKENKACGTGGGILNAVYQSKANPEFWLVLNGDSLLLAELKTFQEQFLLTGADAAILGLNVEDTSRYGRLILDSEGMLREFKEKCPGKGIINGGVYLIRHELLAHFPEKKPLSIEYDVFPMLLSQGMSIYVHSVEVPFLDIGTPKTISLANDFISENMTCFT